MKISKWVLLTIVAVCSLSFAGAETPAKQKVDLDNFLDWISYIRPSDKEDEWKKIAWRNRLMPAVKEAKELDRPILLWAMNGNPCGET